MRHLHGPFYRNRAADAPGRGQRSRMTIHYEDEEDRVVPSTNLGGAAPTSGHDSGGDLPGPEDDLTNLAEPEPPPAPEVNGMTVRPEREIEPTMGREAPEP
jgi:hypothetical protein